MVSALSDKGLEHRSITSNMDKKRTVEYNDLVFGEYFNKSEFIPVTDQSRESDKKNPECDGDISHINNSGSYDSYPDIKEIYNNPIVEDAINQVTQAPAENQGKTQC